MAVAAVHIVGTVWAFWAMRRRLALPLATTIPRLVVPAALVGALAWFVHPEADAWLVAWYAVFAVVFVGLLFVTRAITRDDIDAVREGLIS